MGHEHIQLHPNGAGTRGRSAKATGQSARTSNSLWPGIGHSLVPAVRTNARQCGIERPGRAAKRSR